MKYVLFAGGVFFGHYRQGESIDRVEKNLFGKYTAIKPNGTRSG
jgi:hypothetical protein